MSTTTDTRPPITDHVLARLDSQRREAVAAGIDDTLRLLASDASASLRAAQAEDHMRVVLDHVAEIDERIDDRVWALLTRAVAA